MLAAGYYRRLHQTTQRDVVTLTQQLSVKAVERLMSRNVERVVETEIVETPGKTVTKIVEKDREIEVEVEKVVEKKVEVEVVRETTVAAPAPDHTVSISIYKMAELNPKSWQADAGLKVDSIGADVVIGASGDVTQLDRATFYGGLRWQF